MIELDNDTYDDYAVHAIANIDTPSGPLLVNWIPRRKEILCSYGGRFYRGQNESIGATIATLLECSVNVLVPSDLKVSESRGVFVVSTEKQLSDLLECEWSDYACDKMAFTCYMYVPQNGGT